MVDITRADAAALIQDAYANDFLQTATATSQALMAFPTVNMGTKTTRLPVLATVPHAKWVGESSTAANGKKPTGKASWGSKELVAEELAVIIPIHENVLDDATTDVLMDIANMGGRAIAYALDAAVFAGINKPTTWTSPDLFASATAGGNVFEIGTGVDDLSGSILQAAESLSEHYDPSEIFARAGLRFKLANQRNSEGSPIFVPALSSAPEGRDSVHGLSAHWMRGTVEGDLPVWDATTAEALIVDPTCVRIGVRQDITVKFLDQATVDGVNLAERDMVALRFKARFAYALRDGIADGTVARTASPAAMVTPTATP